MTALLVDAMALVGFLGLSFLAAAMGGRVTVRSLGAWYNSLRKPTWTPSGARIGLIWTVLYVLMAVAAWVLWRDSGFSALEPWVAYGTQLALNVAWSVLFFGLRSPRAALAEIVALWGSILVTVLAFAAVAPLAGLVLLPYLVWVTIAGTLNLRVWQMNRGPARATPSGV